MPATDPLSLGIAAAAVLVATAAGYYRRRTEPQLDGERWLKTTWVTLLRGAVEAEGGDADAWEARAAAVPYHPAGRFPEQKVRHPGVAPPTLLEGEQGLLERLRAVPEPVDRWAVLYDDDEDARALLLDDPYELGAAYAPSGPARPDTTWDDVAAWGAGEVPLHDVLLHRLSARLVLIAGTEPPRLLPHLQALAPGSLRLDAPPPEQLVEAFEEALERPDTRLVLVAEGDAVPGLLQVLVDHAGLRDQVVAVVSVGGVIGGRSDVDEGPLAESTRLDWMERWFGQEHLDTGVVRLTPYMSLQWLDRQAWPPGVAGLPLQHQRFPEPAEQAATAQTIESVDLGVAPHESGDDELLAKALLFVVCGWVASRR